MPRWAHRRHRALKADAFSIQGPPKTRRTRPCTHKLGGVMRRKQCPLCPIATGFVRQRNRSRWTTSAGLTTRMIRRRVLLVVRHSAALRTAATQKGAICFGAHQLMHLSRPTRAPIREAASEWQSASVRALSISRAFARRPSDACRPCGARVRELLRRQRAQ
jgi:hypothetical protein